LITAQSTLGVRRVEVLSPSLFAEQLDVLLSDLLPMAAKTGALGSAAQVELVADRVAEKRVTLVVDPVMVSKTGAVLLDEAGRSALRQRLLPCAALVTPNLDEAALLLGRSVSSAAEIHDAARALVDLGAHAALIKGGHREGEPVDVLCIGGAIHELYARRIDSPHTHGVGCTLSAAITARLALGAGTLEACRLAKEWLTRAIASAPRLGHGQGAVNHLEPVFAEPGRIGA
jgi:hydroxymethylpyrimidine/phosphomethylpyrimidine kinase